MSELMSISRPLTWCPPKFRCPESAKPCNLCHFAEKTLARPTQKYICRTFLGKKSEVKVLEGENRIEENGFQRVSCTGVSG